MEPPRGLVGGATPEDRQAPHRRDLRPGQLTRVLEGTIDRGLHERARDAARPELPAQALAPERSPPGPRLGPGGGKGAIVHVAARLELGHHGLGHVRGRAAAAKATGERLPCPGLPGKQIKGHGTRSTRVERLPGPRRPSSPERGHRNDPER